METTTLHYNGTAKLVFNKGKHHYTLDGKTMDGVTSVLGIKAVPALIPWAANCAADYVKEHLKPGIPLDEIEIQQLIDGAKKAHREASKKAMNYGTMLHSYIESWIKGENPPRPTNPMLLNATEQFHAWILEHNVKFLASEFKLLSKKYQYVGTGDFVAMVDGVKVLGDVKTSSGIYSTVWLQTNAYKAAYLEEHPEETIDHTMILRCGKDGSFEVKECDDFERNFAAFLAALSLYRWDKENQFDAMTRSDSKY